MPKHTRDLKRTFDQHALPICRFCLAEADSSLRRSLFAVKSHSVEDVPQHGKLARLSAVREILPPPALGTFQHGEMLCSDVMAPPFYARTLCLRTGIPRICEGLASDDKTTAGVWKDAGAWSDWSGSDSRARADGRSARQRWAQIKHPHPGRTGHTPEHAAVKGTSLAVEAAVFVRCRARLGDDHPVTASNRVRSYRAEEENGCPAAENDFVAYTGLNVAADDFEDLSGLHPAGDAHPNDEDLSNFDAAGDDVEDPSSLNATGDDDDADLIRSDSPGYVNCSEFEFRNIGNQTMRNLNHDLTAA
ncbi:hypothetical protein EJ03DRAFT_340051 [Teratosphaeria nubilosa]|uniref:Uncharacterized protein n=1 Tax=Teratosphaeria nubilosa TaxID=161662 RepID=A0A6G1KUT5_9PEZI|nr:hypothetical protein EJ03DRAFT_340051 [Teratosphaeria nubilosa]